MRPVICLLAVISCSLSLPSRPLDWDVIERRNAYVVPLTNYTVEKSIDRRIIGGDEITPNSRPYQVALFVDGRSFCGGSMISSNYVLTAAHCTITATYVELVFGAHNILSSESSQVIVSSSSIINHPDYQPTFFLNDVALIKTPSPIVSNSKIRSILLAPADAETYTGQIGFLTGWGTVSDSSNSISPLLRGVNLEVIGNDVCARTYGTFIQSSTLCTSGANNVGGCNGDSGGPLVVSNIQVGIHSFVSSRGCEAGFPTGYSRISSYRSWIAQNSDVPL